MANCIFCGNPAGFLRKKHKDCFQKFQEGICLLNEEFNKQVENNFDKKSLEKILKKIEKENFISITPCIN